MLSYEAMIESATVPPMPVSCLLVIHAASIVDVAICALGLQLSQGPPPFFNLVGTVGAP